MVQESRRYNDDISRKAQKTEGNRVKSQTNGGSGRPGDRPHPGSRPMADQPRGSACPLSLFAQLCSVIFDVLSSLDSETTSKLDETRSHIFIISRSTLELENELRITSIRR